MYEIGQQIVIAGIPYKVTATNYGKKRFTLLELPARPGPKTDEDGSFIDEEFLNGDPVWVLYRLPDLSWMCSAKPQSIYEFAWGTMLAVAGEEPHLYGYRFVDRNDLFIQREAAEAECLKRNSISSPAP